MQNETTNHFASDHDLKTLEDEIREAVATGTHVQETVHRLTLKAINADRINPDSIQRIIAATMQGIHDGAQQRFQHINDQAQTARVQIAGAVAGLDSALASFAAASKLALEEAAGQAKKFSDTELARARADLESLENLFLDTLHKTATTAQGLLADILHDLSRHAVNHGTVVGSQLKETLATFAHQIASVGQAQLITGTSLAHATADLVSKIAGGVLAGIDEQKKNHKA
ncbi:MAG: hypothetical protein LZF61_07380 [Nitrosomonas sp.]|nr:MAG: hypothetical protein LZF61_07380 [Nitrosomonas sp.]